MNTDNQEPGEHTAMPQYVKWDSKEWDNKNVNRAIVHPLLRDKRLKKIRDLNEDTILYRSGYNVFAYDPIEDFMFFFAKFIVRPYRSVGKVSVLQQKLLWASKEVRPFVHLPSWIFFNVMLPETGVITTDGEQTVDGAKFWADRIQDAFERNLSVYYVDLSQPSTNRVKLLNWRHYHKVRNEAESYGDKEKHQFRRFVISINPLPEPTTPLNSLESRLQEEGIL